LRAAAHVNKLLHLFDGVVGAKAYFVRWRTPQPARSRVGATPTEAEFADVERILGGAMRERPSMRQILSQQDIDSYEVADQLPEQDWEDFNDDELEVVRQDHKVSLTWCRRSAQQVFFSALSNGAKVLVWAGCHRRSCPCAHLGQHCRIICVSGWCGDARQTRSNIDPISTCEGI